MKLYEILPLISIEKEVNEIRVSNNTRSDAKGRS